MSSNVDSVPDEAGTAPSDSDSLYFFERISWTPQIEDAAQAAALWISCDVCGAAFWGVPRVGKTEFGKYLEKVPAAASGVLPPTSDGEHMVDAHVGPSR